MSNSPIESTSSGTPLQLKVGGIHCSGCASTIEGHLRKLGLEQVSVDLASNSVTFTPTAALDQARVSAEIKRIGYTIPDQRSSSLDSGKLSTLEQRFLFSLVGTIPLMLHMLSNWHVLHNPWVQLALCIPVYGLGVLHFGKSALGSLRAGIPNMDVLIFIGITASFFYSLTGTLLELGPNYLFYETSASITSLVLLGNVLEERSVRRTTSAIEDLSRMQPRKAKRIRLVDSREEIEELEITQIHLGDMILVNPGDQIPTDGEVVWGAGSVDEAMVSGESMPISKQVGSKLIGGTLLLQGNIKFKASAVGESTVLASIIRLVQEARRSKAKIQGLADRISAVFVPIVLAIAVFTLIFSLYYLQIEFSQALLRSVAVLVIACPCAMGLATPTAVSVGLGMAAKNGILLKGASILEQFASIKRLVFDKTGTLTSGEMIPRAIRTFGITEAELKSIVLSLTRLSSHPISKSLSKTYSASALIELNSQNEILGQGVEAQDSTGNRYKLGSKTFTGSHDLAGDLFLTKNDSLIGALELEERLKPGCPEAVHKLSKLGLDLAILSGDREERVRAIAEQVGIKTYFSERTPQQKLEIISQMEGQKPTGFVGDGINDAASLERAAVGISLSDATQAAINSAQVVLLRGDLILVVKALRIAHLTLRTIKQNLFWAFFYNVLAIPLAAAGYLSPIIAALAMAFSDVIVIGNSLRLRFRKIG